MRILVSRISPDIVGGAELSAFDQTVVLNELGHEAVLVTNLKYLRERAKSLGIKTYWFPWINRGPGKLRFVIFLLLLPFTFLLAPILVWRIKPDIVNTHSREDQNAFTLTKWLHKKPVVWKDPGDLRMQFEPAAQNPMRKIYSRIQRRAIKKTDYIYFLNPDDKQNMVNLADASLVDRSTNIPSSILYRYYDRNATKQDREWGKVIVGTLARLEPEKGLQYLIQAVKKLGCSDRVEYWLVNDGSYKSELEKMAKDLPCVHFFPYTTNMASYLNTFDIFVHPAEFEGWGRVIKEAMYFGLPIIGSRVGGIKMQIEDGGTGLLFKVGAVNELAKHLKKLIDDKEYRLKLGAAAKKKAELDGDFVEIVKKQILPIYQKVLGSK